MTYCDVLFHPIGLSNDLKKGSLVFVVFVVDIENVDRHVYWNPCESSRHLFKTLTYY